MNFYTQYSNSFAYYPYVSQEVMIPIDMIKCDVKINKYLSIWEQQHLQQYFFWTHIEHCKEFMDAQTVTPRKNNIKPKGNKVLLLKRNNFPIKADNLLQTIQTITIGDMVLVSAKKKAESKDGLHSSKRSSFIGVSRNGLHWQALITINKRKTYIGSYECEKDAAVAFDFFSILLHSFTAKTNFSYTRNSIEEMIWNYKQNRESLKPEELSFN